MHHTSAFKNSYASCKSKGIIVVGDFLKCSSSSSSVLCFHESAQNYFGFSLGLFISKMHNYIHQTFSALNEIFWLDSLKGVQMLSLKTRIILLLRQRISRARHSFATDDKMLYFSDRHTLGNLKWRIGDSMHACHIYNSRSKHIWITSTLKQYLANK